MSEQFGKVRSWPALRISSAMEGGEFGVRSSEDLFSVVGPEFFTAGHGGVGEREMVRTCLAGNRHTARFFASRSKATLPSALKCWQWTFAPVSCASST